MLDLHVSVMGADEAAFSIVPAAACRLCEREALPRASLRGASRGCAEFLLVANQGTLQKLGCLRAKRFGNGHKHTH